MLSSIKKKLHERLVQPVLGSNAPVPQIASGVAVGFFVGLTPTMGLQMYIATVFWVIGKSLFQRTFHLPVAIALVWITNPVTVVPIYYVFLTTGNHLLQLFKVPVIPMSYEGFQQKILSIAQIPSWWEQILAGLQFLLMDLGMPMVVGSFCYAIPAACMGYIVTYRVMSHRRSF